MANITTYDFIDSNKRKTALLMVLFPVTLVILFYLAILLFSFLTTSNTGQEYYQSSPLMVANELAIVVLPIVSIIAIIWIVISYFFGQKIVLNMAGAYEITKETAPEIMRMVENIAITAGLPMPRVYIINDNAMNAFATGRDPKHSYIALTKGIITRLEKSELECVIAHEMAHIGNRDIRLMLIMVVCISFSTIIAEILLRIGLVRGRNSKDNGGQILFLILALAFYIYGYLVAPLIKLAVSRTREFQADATAALITRNPQGLINALKKISGNSEVERLNDKETIAAMCIETPLSPDKKNSFFSKISGLFSTHPSIETRIKALMTMDGYRE